MAEPSPKGWDGLLAPDEKILWQGQPVARFDWGLVLSRRAVPGLLFGGFALFWIIQAFSMTRSDPDPDLIQTLFPLFGIPFLLLGLERIFGPAWRHFNDLRQSTYTLTSHNAFIATEAKGKRRLERYALGPGLFPALEEGDPGTVWLTSRPVSARGWFGSGAGGRLEPGTGLERVGFEAIPEARRVFTMLLQAQTEIARAARHEITQEREAARASPPPPPPPPPPGGT